MTESDSNQRNASDEELQLLYRLDERTENIESKVDSVVDSTEDNAEQISANSHRIKRNTTILGGYSAGLMALIMWSADKLARFV